MVDDTDAGSADLACHGCGHTHSNAKLKTLPDGRQAGLQSEDWRHECEIVWALRLPDKVGPRSKKWTKAMYLAEVRLKRGDEAADKLRRDLLKRWKAQRQA